MDDSAKTSENNKKRGGAKEPFPGLLRNINSQTDGRRSSSQNYKTAARGLLNGSKWISFREKRGKLWSVCGRPSLPQADFNDKEARQEERRPASVEFNSLKATEIPPAS